MSMGAWKSSFSPRIAGVQWSYTVGSTLWGMASGVAVVLLSCGDRAGVLPAPAGGIVVAVGCTVLQMWRGGAPWTLQVRVLRAPAVTGHAAIPDPRGQSVGVRTREVRGSRGGPGPLEEGGPGLRLLVLSAPP